MTCSVEAGGGGTPDRQLRPLLLPVQELLQELRHVPPTDVYAPEVQSQLIPEIQSHLIPEVQSHLILIYCRGYKRASLF